MPLNYALTVKQKTIIGQQIISGVVLSAKLKTKQMKKENIVVLIKDEAMLNEARKFLKEAGEKINDICFFIDEDKDNNYLYYSSFGWALGYKTIEEIEITLNDLKKLLNEKKNN